MISTKTQLKIVSHIRKTERITSLSKARRQHKDEPYCSYLWPPKNVYSNNLNTKYNPARCKQVFWMISQTTAITCWTTNTIVNKNAFQ